jgi:predicted restriction endonuclease
MKRKLPKKDSKRAIMKELDIAWAKKVKSLMPECAVCGRTSYLNAHHIFSRRYMSTRWNINNGISLCRGCHLYFAHQKYEEFRDIVLGILGVEGFASLKRESNEIKKWDKEELEMLLQQF